MRATVIGLLLVYPLIVWISIDRFGVVALGFVLSSLLALRVIAWKLRPPGLIWAVGLAIVGFMVILTTTGDDRVLRAYPVLANLLLLALFGYSLIHPPSIIERGLRFSGRAIPAAAPRYLWWVTLAWSVFFLLNSMVTAWTAFAAPISVWAFYNGFLSYCMIGLFFGIEFLARQLYRRRIESQSKARQTVDG